MTKETLINKTIEKLKKLPASKIQEINNYVDDLLIKIDERILTEGIKNLTENSKTYDFLKDEEDLYTVNDLKEKYK